MQSTLKRECTQQTIERLRQDLKDYIKQHKHMTKKDFEKSIGIQVPKITSSGGWKTGTGPASYLNILSSYICEQGLTDDVYTALSKPHLDVQDRIKRARVRGGPASISSYEALVLRLVPISRASLTDLKRFLVDFGDEEPVEDMTKVDIQHRVFDIQQLQTADELETIALQISGNTGEVRPDIQAAVRQTVIDNKARVKRLQQQADGIYDRLKELERRADMKEADKKKIRKCLSVYRDARRKSRLWKAAKIGGTVLGTAAAVGLAAEVYDRNRKDDVRNIRQFIEAAKQNSNLENTRRSQDYKASGPFDCIKSPGDMVQALLHFVGKGSLQNVDISEAQNLIVEEASEGGDNPANEWLQALDKCRRTFFSGKINLGE